MNPWVPAEFETKRLRIRPLRVGDLGQVHAYVSSYSAEGFGNWLGGNDADSVARYIADTVARYGRPPRCDLGITVKAGDEIAGLKAGALIGGVAFRQVWLNPPSVEIGWVIHPAVAGHGLAKEALRGMVNYLLSLWPDLTRFEARVHANDTGARTVLERLHFQLEGLLRSGAGRNGQIEDAVLYGLLRDDLRGRLL